MAIDAYQRLRERSQRVLLVDASGVPLILSSSGTCR
jgi:hypothetical protein